MSHPIIRFESVSKLYQRRQSRSLRDMFVGLQSRQPAAPRAPDRFYALRDASFAIQPGEAVGLIGANGAGKSTTLKLISRVSTPTSGRVIAHGRVGALLELGAGFHPELSGRENIYLNGALLGMSRQELRRKFDAILAFSELEEFINMPVKHYSSGMFARLAFAVNIHVDPEILLVDEVLAVGDVAFQQKCLDRIAELRRQGVTIVLVTHLLGLVRGLCSRAIWLDHGAIRADDAAEGVVRQYLTQAAAGQERLSQMPTRTPAQQPEQPIVIERVRLLDEQDQERQVFHTGQPLRVQMDYIAYTPTPAPIFGIGIHRHDGLHVCGPNTAFSGLTLPTLSGAGTVTYAIPYLPLLEGLYHVTTAVANYNDTLVFDFHDRAYMFRVVNTDLPYYEQFGMMSLHGEWRFEPELETTGARAS